MDNPHLQDLAPHLAEVSSSEPGAPGLRRNLSPYPTLNHDLRVAKRKFASYADIIRRDSLAPSLWDTIFEPGVEKTVAKVFGEPYPRVLDGNTRKPIKWTDVLRESLKPDDFQPQSNGMYQCRVLGRLIEVSKASYIEILTGVMDRLLQPHQGLSGEQKEIKVRTKLSLDIHETHNTLVLFANSIRGSMQDLVSPTVGNKSKHNSTLQKQSQLQTPVSPQVRSSCDPVIYISDTESDNEGSSSDEDRSNAAALTRREPIGIPENDSTDNMASAPKELSKIASSNVWWEIWKDLLAPNPDGAGFVEKDLSRAPDITLRNQNFDGKQARAEDFSPANVSMRARNDANANAALSDQGSRTGSRSPPLPCKTSSQSVGVINRIGCESPSAFDNLVTADTDSAKWSSYSLSGAFDSSSESDRDIDTESVGFDIPYRIEDSPVSGSTAADHGNNIIFTNPVLPRKRRQGVPTSNHTAKKPYQGTSIRYMPKYTPSERSEGPGLVKSLIARGSTAAEIETKYHMRFGVHRSASGLFRKFQIEGSRHLLKDLDDSKRRNTMST